MVTEMVPAMFFPVKKLFSKNKFSIISINFINVCSKPTLSMLN